MFRIEIPKHAKFPSPRLYIGGCFSICALFTTQKYFVCFKCTNKGDFSFFYDESFCASLPATRLRCPHVFYTIINLFKKIKIFFEILY